MGKTPPVDQPSWRTSPESTESVLFDLLSRSNDTERAARIAATHAETYRVIANHPGNSHANVTAAVCRTNPDWFAEEVHEAVDYLHSAGVVRIDGLFRKRLTASYWPVSR